MNAFTKDWFACRLRDFLYDHHPRLEGDERLIEHRSLLAAARFRQAREKG